MNTFKNDFYRLTGKKYNIYRLVFSLFTDHRIRFVFALRELQCISKKRFAEYCVFRICHRKLQVKYGLDIKPQTKIGDGFNLSHAYGITINSQAVIGKNVNISKGATIGMENRGIRKGSPTIGDCVYLGVNSTIVGKIRIGNDVLIAANAFVNTDVPDHSIVVGNPCTIIHKEHATKGYVGFKI